MRSQTWSSVTDDLNSVAARCTKGAIEAHDGEKSTGKRILSIIVFALVVYESLARLNALSDFFGNLRQGVFLQMGGVAVEFANAFG